MNWMALTVVMTVAARHHCRTDLRPTSVWGVTSFCLRDGNQERGYLAGRRRHAQEEESDGVHMQIEFACTAKRCYNPLAFGVGATDLQRARAWVTTCARALLFEGGAPRASGQ
jgi:hypothetical protein